MHPTNDAAVPFLDWTSLGTGAAAHLHGATVELSGWMIPFDPAAPTTDYFLLTIDEPCCGGCTPRDPRRCVEVFASREVAVLPHEVRVRGQLRRLVDDPLGWRYRLDDACYVPDAGADDGAAAAATARTAGHATNDALVNASSNLTANPAASSSIASLPRPPMSRRAFLAGGAALGLAACTPGRFAGYTEGQTAPASGGNAPDATSANPVTAAAMSTPGTTPSATSGTEPGTWRASPGAVTIDMHSHEGHVIVSRNPAIAAARPLTAISSPMRAGGMHVLCLAIVTDTNVTRVSADHKRFEPWRDAQPGELYALSQVEFQRVNALIERERLLVITDAASLATLPQQGPCAIVSAEGADFLEGQLDRVDEAYTQHRLRHLQLTHYRVNELGDIQTEAPVHGGLTDFGADVVRRCNARGIVIDVAHGTYDLVKRAAATTTKPLVLSHTALVPHPKPRSRMIGPDHARAVADTGGVIGVWPSSGSFHDLQGMADGMRRMVDVVGVEHVGLGTDMLGFISPPVFRSYRQLPALGDALRNAGFSQTETEQILGGNYRRVFEASMA